MKTARQYREPSFRDACQICIATSELKSFESSNHIKAVQTEENKHAIKRSIGQQKSCYVIINLEAVTDVNPNGPV
jgi:hypothetical protein